ncbi:MAG: hypothetical protein AAFN78_11585, partial [Pseudomonadota bacterium]
RRMRRHHRPRRAAIAGIRDLDTRVVTPHSTADQLTVDRWNQWMTVADDGSVHLIYYSTLGDASRTSANLYYTFSEDGAQTWTTPERLTSETSPNINDGFEWGDYNGLAVTMDHIIAAYTDNRNEGGGGGDSVDIYAVGQARDGGPGPVYTLAPTSPGQAGAENLWSTTNGTPNRASLILFSGLPGSASTTLGPCTVTTGLANPRPIAFALADASGSATARRFLPPQISGVTFRFQALDIGSCTVSNVTTTTF